jgi:ADP-heptose:LPS heptosyltransferase
MSQSKASHTFLVPSGIGDISWLYAKLSSLPYTFDLVVALDGPQRSLPYLELLPRVEHASYGTHHYKDLLGASLEPRTDMLALEPGTYKLSFNKFLEDGGKLADFFPSLPTSYHYSFKPELDSLSTPPYYKEGRSQLIGIYPSKYQTIGWKFWEVSEWRSLMKMVETELGECHFVILGAEFDVRLGDDIARGLPNATSLVGKTSIGQAINLIKQMDYFFAYPSGLGILADVVDTPAMMFIPQDTWAIGLVDSYADPDNIKSGRHINRVFCTPKEAFSLFMEKGAVLV